jgi:hypothetical protein
MAEERDRFIHRLEDAANSISVVPRRELQILLRRAALQLRNVDNIKLYPDLEQAVAALGAALDKSKNETIRIVLRDWLTANGYMPFHDLDEDTKPDGTA